MSTQQPSESSEYKTTVAILFSDLVNSTGLYDSKGDTEARRLVSSYLQNLRQIINQNSGTVVKSLGDGLLSYFTKTDDALQAAIEIHQTPTILDAQIMQSHIGLHYGDIIIRKNDIFGDAVNLASRLTDIAKPEQTILSEHAAAQCSEFFKAQLRNIDETILKGKKQAISIYELMDGDDDQTIMFTPSSSKKIPVEQILKLSYLNHRFSFNKDKGSFSIGRVNDCDIMITSPLISRHHAKINYHKGKFIYIDQSTNGSYIRSSNNREVFLRREQTILPDKGTISVGTQTDEKSAKHLIYFIIQ